MKTWLKRLGIVFVVGMLGLGGVFLSSTGCGRSMGGTLSGERLLRAEKSPHFVDGKFVNRVPTSLNVKGRELDVLTRFLTVESVRTPPGPMPIISLKKGDFADPPSPGLEVVWLGHATNMIDLEGHRIMTDPMLSEIASPISWLGPSRYHQAPMGIEDLPKVDVVVVSHDHYDHLDMATVEALARAGTLFVVPLGIGAHLEAWDVPPKQIVELQWGESRVVGDLTIHCVPARHYSGRGVFDQNEALWAGWVLKGKEKTLYYSGDTGFSDHFAEVGERFGPIDITLIKIGEYDETWPEIHIDPEEAVRAHVAARGQLMLPVHWGTFNLAYHDWDDPIKRAVKAAVQAGAQLATPRPGERVVVGGAIPTDPWWEGVK